MSLSICTVKQGAMCNGKSVDMWIGIAGCASIVDGLVDMHGHARAAGAYPKGTGEVSDDG
ncbi:hypothetical protein [Bifidobacterium tsurumiense]|uniref:hypothetical protein n=1 Tax=Bifidobacterium tsurumiense TaxID=356829 RepID=UPI00041F4254|nr:hypothetical protein [Bifidobacterium tsurumiense]MSS13390.1 hypothetical protein [Bifidobacterium tsurumiense]